MRGIPAFVGGRNFAVTNVILDNLAGDTLRSQRLWVWNLYKAKMPLMNFLGQIDATSYVNKVFERSFLIAATKRGCLSEAPIFLSSCQKVCFLCDRVVREETHIPTARFNCSGWADLQSDQNCTIILKKDWLWGDLLNLVSFEEFICLVAGDLWACCCVEHKYKIPISGKLMANDRQFRTTWIHSQGCDHF